MTQSHKSHLRQSNKPFKGTTKRKEPGGKTVARPRVKSAPAVVARGKQERANAAKDLRKKRREETRAKRRIGAMSSEAIPPKIAMLLPLKSGVDVTDLKNALASLGESVLVGNGNQKLDGGDVMEDSETSAVQSKICQPVTFQLPPWAQTTSTGEGRKQCLTLIDASAHLYPRPSPLPSIVNPKKNDDDVPQTEFVSKEGLQTVLDIAKTANIIVCVLPGTCSLDDPPFDDLGYELLSALKLQGFPTPIGVMIRDEGYNALDVGELKIYCVECHLSMMVDKYKYLSSINIYCRSSGKQKERRKLVNRYFTSEFGAGQKFIAIDDPANDLKSLLRALSNAVPKEFSWRAMRGYLVPDRCMLLRNQPDGRIKLIVEGFARGLGFTVKHPLHLTGIGDVIADRIIALENPLKAQRKVVSGQSISGSMSNDNFRFGTFSYNPILRDDMQNSVGSERLLEKLTVDMEKQLQEEWECLRPYDPLAGEQTWPTEEELKEAEDGQKREVNRRLAVPKGTSAYQQAWLDEEVQFDGAEDVQEEIDDDTMGNNADEEHEEVDFEEDDESIGEPTVTNDIMMDDMPQHTEGEMIAEKNRLKFELEERSREDLEFPDEVDTPLDQPARERFTRYRGLKSFKTSKWDPYEDLPAEYSRIYEFDSFRPTMNFSKHQFIEDCMGVCGGMTITGLYIRLEIRLSNNDPTEASKVDAIQKRLERIQLFNQGHQGLLPIAPLLISTLLPFERKTSVSHMRITRVNDFIEPLQSKTLVEMQCGFRRYLARPIFSTGTNTAGTRISMKSRFHRFLHQGSPAVASVYAPTIFPPAPVLVFKSPELPSEEALSQSSILDYPSSEELEKATKLAAWGSVLEPDARRVIIKRIVLTGYPFRVHKKKAVVRFMFFNPSDIRWFSPVELATKKGLRGHIKEPLGTHGYMKCIFNDYVDQSDTVCMYLYKRVYPKWFPPTWGGDESQTPTQ
ncbi:pre-rRNA-processing protein TSR1 homolog [Condylostylus longicornis]|uniref:pre-rRNA-processing protein TSR1 homolog n=1 Tax=Condylostylus longicornis TaxID=2530218 RepID=UPI00244E025E|nr:pre-rRNA-processing protein TSR1 homolog [Condylostylus longicornis]